MTGTPSLEERVAALEDAIRFPLRTIEAPPMSDDDIARFRDEFTKATRPLTPEQVRQLLAECFTVIKPGEHLIIRVPWTTTPTQLRELQDFTTQFAEELELPFRTLILPGDQLAVTQPEETPGAA